MANTHKTKPVNVEAKQWDGTNVDAMYNLVKGNANLKKFVIEKSSDQIILETTLANLKVDTNSWVLIHADNSISVLNNTDFVAAYDPI